jgi:sec-independent protein translocase protein TatA
MGLDNPIHIAFLLVILLLVFGAKRLPEMGQSLGSGLRGFKDSLTGTPDSQHADELPAPTPITATPITATPVTADRSPERREHEFPSTPAA